MPEAMVAARESDAADGTVQQCDVAVVIPTVLRPSLHRAVSAVFSQDFTGTDLTIDLDGIDLSLEGYLGAKFIIDGTEFGDGNSNALFLHLLESDLIWKVNCQKQFQDL